ncbi:MAG TPA: FAD-binding oxidoreductase [Thermoanaerobacterales bacterium]|nr:FAD-binding oxidoreductase [Thermoanaerobacterales bacterium]
MKKSADAVIVGGGVIGTSIAYYLSKKGIKPILLERDDLASGSSGACDIDIILQSKNPGIHLQLAMESAKMYKTLADELDFNIEYETCGGMILIENEEQLKVMRDFVKRQKAIGLQVKLLDLKEASEIQPGLSPHLVGATYSPQDAHVNPMKLCQAFAKAAKELGTEVYLNTGVLDIRLEKGKVKSVITSKGEVQTKTVINAAGVYAPMIGEMVGLSLPIKPRRGQIIVTEPVPKLVMADVLCAKYIVAKYNPKLIEESDNPETRLGVGLSLSQTHDGQILIGATREFVGYNKNTTHEALRAILRNATRLVPALKSIHAIRSFAGLRPYTPDGLPLLGQVEGIQGFIMAAGHEGDGIALSPVTGRIISELIVDGKTFMDISCMSPVRFGSLTDKEKVV